MNPSPIFLNEIGTQSLKDERYGAAIHAFSRAIEASQQMIRNGFEHAGEVSKNLADSTQCKTLPQLCFGDCAKASFDIFEQSSLESHGGLQPLNEESQNPNTFALFFTNPMHLTEPENLYSYNTGLISSCAVVFNLGLVHQLRASEFCRQQRKEEAASLYRKAIQFYEKSMQLFSKLCGSGKDIFEHALQGNLELFHIVHLTNVMACYTALGEMDSANRLFGTILATAYAERRRLETGGKASRMSDISLLVERVTSHVFLSSANTAAAA